MHIKKKWIGLFIFCSVIANAGTRDNVRGTRYCEIIVTDGWLRCAVYTTEGINHCPDELWRKITPKDAEHATGAAKAMLQGPRYWVMDKIQTTPLIHVEEKKFKQLKTKKIAYVHIGLSDILNASKPYRKHTIDLHNTFTYKAGKPIYEIIDSKGHVYVMQSYSSEKSKQTENSLLNLGTKLKLPKGWRFKAGVSSKTVALKTKNNKAVVLHDDFKNRYQLSPYDLLK
jgi:hypothetical protein